MDQVYKDTPKDVIWIANKKKKSACARHARLEKFFSY